MEPAPLRQQLQAHQGTIILRDIDCGQQVQFWLVTFTPAELEKWWTSQTTFDPDPDGEFDTVYAMFGETAPLHGDRVIPPGKFLSVVTEDDLDLWVEMSETNEFYFCVICCDSDSFLKRPDGTRILHKGSILHNPRQSPE